MTEMKENGERRSVLSQKKWKKTETNRGASRRRDPRFPTPTSAPGSRTERVRNFPVLWHPAHSGWLFCRSLALLFCGVPFLLRGRSKCWRSIENCGFSVKGWSRPGTRDPDEAVAGRPARGGFSLAFLRYWRKKICKVCIFLCSFH